MLALFYFSRTSCAPSNKSWFTKIYCSLTKNIVCMILSSRGDCESSKELWLTQLSCSLKKNPDVSEFLIMRLFFTNRARIFGKPKMLARFYFSRTSLPSSNKSWFTMIYCSMAKHIVRMILSSRGGCESRRL